MIENILISVLSWEDRFILGLEKNLESYQPSIVIIFCYQYNMAWKDDNYEKTKSLVDKDRLVTINLNSERPEETWAKFKDTIARYCSNGRVLVDITTMTREAIWLTLYNCRIVNAALEYIYFKPQLYSEDWLSRDPDRPRLLYKMSGIAKLGAPTLLVVTGGYDIQRLDSLIYNFEPKFTMLFFQEGNTERNKKNYAECKALFNRKYGITNIYEYDAYDVNKSVDIITKKLNQRDNTGKTYINRCNIVLNSLGAKTSAITLFKIWIKYPHTALSYIPSKEYNKEYSVGISDYITGELKS